MTTRKAIMYDILVEYYKNYSNKPPELISRTTDCHYNLEVAIVFALHAVRCINRSKKKLLLVIGCNEKEQYSLKAEDFSAAQRRKDIQKALNNLLEESDSVVMAFKYADNKIVELTINKTKHNNLRKTK